MGHVNIRYIVDRISSGLYWSLNTSAPWLTKESINLIDQYLKKDMRGLEFGSGRSTKWFAKRCGHLVSIEGNSEWYDNVQKQLVENNLTNVDYIFSKCGKGDERADTKYANAVSKYEDVSFDFALVDGEARDKCAKISIDKLKPGGILIIDNVNWFLPSNSRSPSSRKLSQNCANDLWERIYGEIKQWESIWTSNGVADTAIFYKPI